MKKKEPLIKFGLSELYRNNEKGNWIITYRSLPAMIPRVKTGEKEIDDKRLLEIILYNTRNPRLIFEIVKEYIPHKLCLNFEKYKLSSYEKLDTLNLSKYSIKINSGIDKVLVIEEGKNLGIGEVTTKQITKSALIKLINADHPDRLTSLVPYMDEAKLKRIKQYIQEDNEKRVQELKSNARSTINGIDSEISNRKTEIKINCIKKLLGDLNQVKHSQKETIDVETIPIGRIIIGDAGSAEYSDIEFGGNSEQGYMIVQEGENEDFGMMRFSHVFDDFKDSIKYLYDLMDYLDDFNYALKEIQKHESLNGDNELIEELLSCLN